MYYYKGAWKTEYTTYNTPLKTQNLTKVIVLGPVLTFFNISDQNTINGFCEFFFMIRIAWFNFGEIVTKIGELGYDLTLQ